LIAWALLVVALVFVFAPWGLRTVPRARTAMGTGTAELAWKAIMASRAWAAQMSYPDWACRGAPMPATAQASVVGSNHFIDIFQKRANKVLPAGRGG